MIKPSINKYKIVLAASLLMIAAVVVAGVATASILASPLRIVFNDRTRSKTVLILNTSDEMKTYRFGWRLMKATPKGDYEDVEKNDRPFGVEKMVMISPKQIKLAPQATQNVRLSLRRPVDLPNGEYRAHFFAEEVLDEKRITEQKDQKQVSVQFNVVFGVSIPVIVRQGSDVLPNLKIDNVSIKAPDSNTEDQRQQVVFDIVKTGGNRSLYGLINIFAQTPEGERQIARRYNVSIFTEQNKREINIESNEPLQKGMRLRIVYEGLEEYQGKTLAEKSIDVQ